MNVALFTKRGRYETRNCINNMLQEIGTFCNSYYTFSSRNLFAYIFGNNFHPSFKYICTYKYSLY